MPSTRAGSPRNWCPRSPISACSVRPAEQYGGHGSTPSSYGLICQELERGDSGIRSFVSVQSSLCMYPIYAYGTEEQRMRWLPDMAAGKVIGCFGLTEPQGGSDPANMKTNARATAATGSSTVQDVDHQRQPRRHRHRLGADRRRHPGLHRREGMAGFAAQEIKHKMSLRASVTSSLFFDNVRVPEANRLPNVKGLKGRSAA
jgi:glutaryl-CoA dehydrogenase